MKNRLAKSLTVFIIALLLVGILPAYAGDPVVDHVANAMWIEEQAGMDAAVNCDISIDTNDWSVDDEFTVTVWTNISTVPSTNQVVGGWQFKLVYNNAILECTDCVYSEGSSSQFLEPINTYAISPSYGADYVMHSEMWDSTKPAPNPKLAIPAHGALSVVTFKIIDSPPKYANFTDLLVLEPVLCKVLDDIGTDVIGDPETYDCPYYYEWAPPTTNPHLAVDPPSLLFDKFSNHTGEEFDIDLNIENLDSAWKMSNITFNLNYDDALIEVRTVTFNTADFDGTNSFDNSTAGILGIVARTTKTLYAPPPLTVVTVRFMIIYQDVYPNVNSTALTFSDVVVWNTVGEIPTPDADEPGEVIIEGLTELPFPWLEVVAASHEVTLGPDWVVGQTFKVHVTINYLHEKWFLVGYEFRLKYCPDLLQVVSVEEGPYFPEHGQNPAPPQTFFISMVNPDYLGPHILVADIILPNSTAYPPAYTEPLPGAIPPEDGILATITFKVLKQCCWDTYTCDLELFRMKLIDKKGVEIGINDANVTDGKVTILPFGYVGGKIDVYTQYESPYGGQGLYMPSDMFWPQKEVILCANVTYNGWPVQQKLVTFIVWDNFGHIWTTLEDVTDEDGVACVSFRMPWPCDDPERYLGVWRVRADVDIACDVYIDELEFHYDYLMAETTVTTDKRMYTHCEDVVITVTFKSHRQQLYENVAIRVTIHDELNVPIASTVLVFDLDLGAQWCTPTEYRQIFELHIDKFATAGHAMVYAVPRMYWEGEWVSAGPQGSYEICILPM